MKTAINDALMETTVNPISLAPSRAASIGARPAAR